MREVTWAVFFSTDVARGAWSESKHGCGPSAPFEGKFLKVGLRGYTWTRSQVMDK
jgi:hypothetical protein